MTQRRSLSWSFSRNDSNTSVAVLDTFQKATIELGIASLTESLDTSDWEVSIDSNRLTYKGILPQRIYFSGKVDIRAFMNLQTVKVAYAKNGVVEENYTFLRCPTTSRLHTATIFHTSEMSLDDYIEIFVTSPNSNMLRVVNMVTVITNYFLQTAGINQNTDSQAIIAAIEEGNTISSSIYNLINGNVSQFLSDINTNINDQTVKLDTLIDDLSGVGGVQELLQTSNTSLANIDADTSTIITDLGIINTSITGQTTTLEDTLTELKTNTDTIISDLTTTKNEIRFDMLENRYETNMYNEQVSLGFLVVLQNTAVSRTLPTTLYSPFFSNGSITVDNQTGEIILAIDGTANSFALLRSKRVASYRAGFSTVCRFALLFGTPQVGNLQLAGIANAQSDIYFGYNITGDFGVRYSTNGLQQALTLTITTASGGGSLALTLDSVLYTITLTNAGGNLNFTAFEIANGNSYGGLWNAFLEGPVVHIVANVAGTRGGVYSAVFTGAGAATLTIGIVGAPLTTVFVPLASCNGDADLKATLNPQTYNMYAIEYGYYGSSPIIWKILDADQNRYRTLHTVRFNNIQTSPNLSNPNLYVSRLITSLTPTLPVTIKTLGSFMAIYGNSRPLGREPIFSIDSTKTFSNATIPIVNFRHRDFVNSTPVFSEFVIGILSVSNNGSKNTIIKIYRSPQSIGSNTTADFPIWTPMASSSITLYDINANSIVPGTNNSPIFSFVLAPADSKIVRLDDLGIFFGVLDTCSITATNTQSTEVSVSVQIIEQTN